MRAALLAVLLVTPAFADKVPGLDEPAFRVPFDRALQGDDPTALKELYVAAEAGNTAAILALPVVSFWLRATLPFSERKTLARINGTPTAEAFAAADPTAALWAMGDPGSDMDALLQRAFGLFAAGEPDKATFLFMNWVNQTGGYGELPPGFFDQPVPRWAMALVLQGRLQDTVFAPAAETDALIVERLKVNDPAVWIALAGYAGLHRTDGQSGDTARLANIFKAAGIPQDEAAGRMAEVLPALKAFHRVDRVLDPETAAAATKAFRGDPGFEPLLALCASMCPQTKDQCTAAFVAGFGHPYGRATLDQPLTSLISTADFFATPRGRLILLRSTAGALGEAPASSSALTAARKIDDCLADAILATAL